MLAIPAFVVPFTFAYNEALMLNGDLVNMISGVVTGAIGVFFIGMSVAGFTNKEMSLIPRILMFVGGVAMIVPQMAVSIVGLVVCVIAFMMAGGLNKKEAAA